MKAYTTPMNGLFDLLESFPSIDFRNHMNEMDPIGSYTLDMVDNMYYHYKTGVENNIIPWYDSEQYDWLNSPQIDYVEKMTNFDRQKVEAFFWNLDYLTKKGTVKAIYIQIDRPESDPAEKLARFGKGASDLPGQVFKKMGWLIGGLAVVIVGGYSMPYIMKAMNKKKKR